MNHIYHSIWNDALGAWVAVSEIARGQGKRSSNRRKKLMTASVKDWQSSMRLLATSLLLCSSVVWALPTGDLLIAGQATVNTPSAGQMQIDQASQRAVINWQGFSIAPNEAVNIQQPNAQAALLNRVVGADASQIQGQLHANGQVYLVNPNGVVFDKTAQVDVGGLIASTHEISNADFMAGKNHFTQNGATGTVENHGTINVPNGGVVALISSSVTNTGTINTPKGTTALAAGKTVDLDFTGNGLIEVKVSEAALNAQITNKGAIQADGGRVVLTAKAAGQLIDTVINQAGIIKAQGLVERNGEIILDGGDNGTVQVSGTIDTSTNQGLNSNNASNGSPNLGLNATGGNITVKGADIQLVNGAIVTASGNTGGGTITIGDKQNTQQTTIAQGATVSTQALDSGTAGTIKVFANMDSGTVNVAGKLDASAPNNGDGGFIDTSAAQLKIADSANISTRANTGKTGAWLIDPFDFTIAATGGNITGTALSSALNSNGVTILAGNLATSCTGATCTAGSAGVGDINVNDVINWSSNSLLTLNAWRNININANITGSGANSKLVLLYGQGGGATDNYFINNGVSVNLSAGQNFSTKQGAAAVQDYTVITSLGTLVDATVAPATMTLQGMNTGLAGNYVLGANIDASPTSTAAWGATGFMPVGDWNATAFRGQFDGLGHTITGLSINRPTMSQVGLFGGTDYSLISNVGILGGSVIGGWNVGGLVGINHNSTITNAYATGSVTGTNNVGGLVGDNQITSTITNAYATGSVTGTNNVGGLVGGNSTGGSINNAYATGSVSGASGVGGLVGGNDTGGSINNAYATGSVTGTINVGGLVGYNDHSINNAYATVSVTGTINVGGLVGNNYSGIIDNAYATGSVTGTDTVGGLVGSNNISIINNAYATGSVTGTNNVGGLVGVNSFSTISNSFWNTQTQTNGITATVGNNLGTVIVTNPTGKTTAEMQQMTTFSNAGWNIASTGGSSAIWRIYEGTTAPLLRSFLTPLTVTANNISKTYNGLSDSTVGNASYSVANATTSGHLSGIPTVYSSPKDVGSYVYPVPIFYSDQQGYDISFVNGVLTINPAPLTITANNASKTYGQTLNFAGTEFLSSGLVNGESIDTVGLSSDGANATAGVTGSPYAISAGNATGGTFNANNYSITYNNGKLTINRAPLTIIANNDIKFFNGSAYQGGNGVFYFGLVNNETSQHLAGILSYGGSSQGAINSGRYVITPMGFDSDNYQITYIDGSLNIMPSFIPPYVPPNPIPITLSEINDNSSSVDAKVSVNEVSDDFTISNSSSEKINRTIVPTLSMKNSAGKVKRLKLSANKQFLSLLLEDGSVRVWDFQRGVQRSIVVSNKNQALTDISTVNDEGELLSVASNAGIGAYDIIGWLLDDKLAIKESDVKHFVSSDDGNLLLVDIGAGDLSLWDQQQKKLLWQLPYQRGTVNKLALTNDKHYAAVLSRQQGVYIYKQADGKLKPITDAVDIIDLATGKIVKSLPNLGEDVIYSRFKDNDTLSIGLATGELSDWSIATGSKKPVAHFSETIVTVDHDRDTYAYIAESGAVRIGNGQGDIQLSIQNKDNPITDAKLLAGGKKLLTVLDSGDLALWDVASGKKILRLFSTQQGWTVMDAFGRFDGSDEAMENFNWIADEEKIPLDSFSENYYEPGLLSNILNDQDNLNNNLDAVRDGITLPPKVDIQLAAQQDKSDKVALQLDVYDRGGGINKVSLYHNGKLIRNEDSVIATQTMQDDNAEHRVLNINVTPSAGKNTLKVVASNTAGIENSSSEINFDGKTKAYQSSVRLMTVGINHYKERKFHLNYTVADAELIGETIKNNSNLIASKNLTNEHATKPHILADLKELSQGVQQDVLVIYFAGHGLALGKEWYFLPYETELQPTPEQIADYGITATELSDIFKDSKIQHILLMVDACYSGAGLDAFSKLENGQRYLTRRLGRSLGITVITAATKDQAAMELKSLGHGLFTYLISQEIANKESDKSITAHGIAENIAKTLPKLSKEMLGSSQEPTAYIRGDDFMLTNLGDNKK